MRSNRLWMFVAVAATLTVAAARMAPAVLAQPPVARPQTPPSTTGATTAQPAQPKPAQAKPTPPAVAAPAAASATTPKPAAVPADAPPPASALGAPLYPSAQYLGSYDAGRGQRFYLYGSSQPFTELVGYYRTILKDKGELVFDAPATHQFDVGRYKETDVDFTPGVTIKDFTWGGAQGYRNTKPGASPSFFPTVIQFTSPPPGMGGRPK